MKDTKREIKDLERLYRKTLSWKLEVETDGDKDELQACEYKLIDVSSRLNTLYRKKHILELNKAL